MLDADIRAALDRHWQAAGDDDFATEHAIYHAAAVLDYPQSRERIRGRDHIEASRRAQPDSKRFAVQQMLGGGTSGSPNSFSRTATNPCMSSASWNSTVTR